MRRSMAEGLIQQILDALSSLLNDQTHLTWTYPATLEGQRDDHRSGFSSPTAFLVGTPTWRWRKPPITAGDVAERMADCVDMLLSWGQKTEGIWRTPFAYPVQVHAGVDGRQIRCWLVDAAGTRLDLPPVHVPADPVSHGRPPHPERS